MAHSLILGMTESGKTTLAKSLAREYRAKGIETICLDPLADPDWQATYVTDNPEEFLRVFWASESCAVFIDEAGDAVGRYDAVMHRTATRGRHCGHMVHYITQGGTQLAPIVRNQCTQLFLFTTSLGDCKIHANEWNQPRLIEASQFKQGEFFHVSRYGALKHFGGRDDGRTRIDDGRRREATQEAQTTHTNGNGAGNPDADRRSSVAEPAESASAGSPDTDGEPAN